jgi:hypothetical protein
MKAKKSPLAFKNFMFMVSKTGEINVNSVKLSRKSY